MVSQGSTPAEHGGPPRTRRPAGTEARAAGLVDVSDGWEDRARCRDEDATLFFGPNGFEPKRERLAREAAAKAICRGCPAIRVCREYALAEGEMYGVWGGLSEADRRVVLEGRGIVATAV